MSFCFISLTEWRGRPPLLNQEYNYNTSLYSYEEEDIDIIYVPRLQKFVIPFFDSKGKLSVHTIDEQQKIKKISNNILSADLQNAIYGFLPDKERMVIYSKNENVEPSFIILNINDGNYKKIVLPSEFKDSRIINCSSDLEYILLADIKKNVTTIYNVSNKTYKYLGIISPYYFLDKSIVSFSFSSSAQESIFWDYLNTDLTKENLKKKYIEPFFPSRPIK